jgi:hypothetical protein
MGGTLILTGAMLGVVPATQASAQPRVVAAAASTPYSAASFLTYATGSQVHLNAVATTASKLLGVEQAFSAVSANTGGLGTAINDPQTGALVQPSEPGANAYGRGSGLEVGAGLTPAQQNQLQLGLAEAKSPPISAPVTKTTLPLNLGTLLTAGVLKGIAGAAFLPSACPIGEPLAYGEGDAAGVSVLSSTVGLSSGANQTAQSVSRSDLVANADGTFGLQSTVKEILAPISINLGTGLSIQVSVGGSGINAPITLATSSDGEGHNKTTLTDTGTLVVSLVSAGVTTTLVNVNLNTILGPNGLVVDANTIPVVGALLTTLGITLDLNVAVPPKAIAGFPTGPNAVSAAFNLVSLNLGLGATQIAGLDVGHMETGVDLASGAIACSIPMAKTANPMTVTAGNTFTWSISIPASAASVADSSCDFTNITASDKISVQSGSPTFTINSISNGGTYNASTGTVTWASLPDYVPGTPPEVLTISVSVPANSPTGVLEDTATATASLGTCTGGPITGVASLVGDVSGVHLTGSITLIGPAVTGAAGSQLPFTGQGPELAWIAAGLLAMAEVSRRLLRRARNNA